MKQPKNTSILKATARERLLGHYGASIAAIVLYRIISFLIIDIVISAIIPSNLLTYLIYYAAVILVNLFFGVFDSGFAYFFMNIIYSQPVSVSDIFHGFKNHPDKAIILQIPLAVMDTLTIIPLQVFSAMRAQQINSGYHFDRKFFIGVLAVLAVISIINLYVRLMLSQTYFLLQDYPEKEATAIFKTSIRLMKGSKFRLFLMYLSFIPISIIGALACFVPIFWVSTYKYASEAAFYQDLISLKE